MPFKNKLINVSKITTYNYPYLGLKFYGTARIKLNSKSIGKQTRTWNISKKLLHIQVRHSNKSQVTPSTDLQKLLQGQRKTFQWKWMYDIQETPMLWSKQYYLQNDSQVWKNFKRKQIPQKDEWREVVKYMCQGA